VMCLVLSTTASAMDYQYTTKDAPFPGVTDTALTGSNDFGDIVGLYQDQGKMDQGVLLKQRYVGTLLNVIPQGINNAGAIVGLYLDKKVGFVLQHGTFTVVKVPACNLSDPAPCDSRRRGPILVTDVWDSNEAGVVVGSYRDGTGVIRSFTYDPRQAEAQRYQVFDPPWPQSAHVAMGINNWGTIVGFFLDPGGLSHGYIKHGAQFTPFDVPGAVETELVSINDAEQILLLADGHTFIWDGDDFDEIQVPMAQLTQGYALTNTGTVVGRFLDGTNTDHGFVARLVLTNTRKKPSGVVESLVKRGRVDVCLSGSKYRYAYCRQQGDVQ